MVDKKKTESDNTMVYTQADIKDLIHNTLKSDIDYSLPEKVVAEISRGKAYMDKLNLANNPVCIDEKELRERASKNIKKLDRV
jgi:hypothetical protein